MPLPSTIAGYEPEWAILGQQLLDNGRATLKLENVKLATRLRYRFYGFRNALKKHDPDNPWLAAMMETQATLTPEGNLLFERNPYANIIRAALEKLPPPPPPKPDPRDTEPLRPQHMDDVLAKLGYGTTKPDETPKE